MNFKLEITTKERQLLNLSNGFKVTEIQKNRLNENTIENKITIVFDTLQSYKEQGEDVITANIDYLKISTEEGTVIFERNNILQENISLFSNITSETINMDIIVFDKIN